MTCVISWRHYTPASEIAALPDGSLRLEWTAGSAECSAEISPGGEIYMHALDLPSDADWDYETSVPKGLGVLREFVAGMRP